MLTKEIHANNCVKVDTAGQATVTSFLHLLDNYKAFSGSLLYPIYLVTALDTNSKV